MEDSILKEMQAAKSITRFFFRKMVYGPFVLNSSNKSGCVLSVYWEVRWSQIQGKFSCWLEEISRLHSSRAVVWSFPADLNHMNERKQKKTWMKECAFWQGTSTWVWSCRQDRYKESYTCFKTLLALRGNSWSAIRQQDRNSEGKI